MGNKLKKIIWVAFLAANSIAIYCYLLACLVPFFNAGNHWLIAMMGLAFPILFFTVLVFCLYWLIKRSKWVFLSIAALLLGWQQVSVTFGFQFGNHFNNSKKQGALRVLSWNLSSWGQTNQDNWTATNYRNEMINAIKNADPDVLCFQEFPFSTQTRFQDAVIPELKEQGYQYSYFVKAGYAMRLYNQAYITGGAIISKYPITDTAKFEYSENSFAEPLIYADININNQKIRVFTTHLQSVRFGEYDYETLHKLKTSGEASFTQSRAVAGKLKQAYKKRAQQAEQIHAIIKESLYPVILCGDFNDVPNSYTYFTARGNMQDAFLKTGFGLGRTYRFLSPTLRIDYILADKKFTVDQSGILKLPYSDHYPVLADIDIKAKH